MAIALGSAVGAERPTDLASISLDAPRVVVLKSKRLLHVFDGQTLVRTYAIDLGSSPVGQKVRQGDGRTPTGRFRVCTKNTSSPYHRFIGIDYPDESAVDRGLACGLLSPGEAASIRKALADGQCPDWGTAVGGGIGIHGHRKGRDWTGGCIALSNEHVEELFSVLRIGDPVEILP
jgi:murein L,D-transpeptidase YafK